MGDAGTGFPPHPAAASRTLLGKKLLLAEATDGPRRGQTDSDPPPDDLSTCPIKPLLLLEQNQGPHQHRKHPVVTPKHWQSISEVQASTSLNTEASTERSQKGGQRYWMKTGIQTHAQAQISLSYPILSYGYKASSRYMLSYLQPIKGTGRLLLAFSRLQSRFSALTQGTPGAKRRAVQPEFCLKRLKKPLIIHVFMQIDSYKREAKKEELWNTLAHPLHTNEFRLRVFSFVSSLLQGLGTSWGQGSQWGALARTFPQSSWLALQARREMSLPAAPLLLCSQSAKSRT